MTAKTQDSTQTLTHHHPVQTLNAHAKTLSPKTHPKRVPNTTQCKHWSLVPKRLNPNLYPTPPSVNTEHSCQNFTTQDSSQTCTQYNPV